MDISQVIKSIDKFFKDLNIKCKKEIDKKGNIVITGIGPSLHKEGEVNQIVFSVDKTNGNTEIVLLECATNLYLDVKELAEKIKGRIFMNGRIVDDYHALHTAPSLSESISTPPILPNIKSEMDPKNINSDERFLNIVSKIKGKMQSEMPIMAAEIIEQLGDGLDDTMKEKLKQTVYATATTTSMLTIRFLMETINEVVGE